jgi:hypothetical protein
MDEYSITIEKSNGDYSKPGWYWGYTKLGVWEHEGFGPFPTRAACLADIAENDTRTVE